MLESCSSGWRFVGLLVILCAVPTTAATDTTALIGRPVASIDIVSDQSVDTNGLLALVPFRVGKPLQQDDVDTAQRLLELKGLFRSVQIELLPEADEVVVRIRLKLKRVIAAVRVNGYTALSTNDVRRLVRLAPGTIFDHTLVETARERLLERYRKLGFVDPRVVASFHETKKDVEIDFVITEGPQRVIASVQFAGDLVLSDDAMRCAVTDLDKNSWRRRMVTTVRAASGTIFSRPDVLCGTGRLEGRGWTRTRQRAAERGLLRRLRQAGYYDARVSSTWEEGSNYLGTLTFTIEAGPPFHIEVVGDSDRRLNNLMKEEDLWSRLIITDGTWRSLGKRLKQGYRDDGYYLARVRVEIEDDVPKRIRFVVDKGRRFRIRRIEFHGNRALSDSQLRDEMVTRPARWVPFPRSGVLNDDILDDDLKRLRSKFHRHGYEQVRIARPEPLLDEDNGTIDLIIDITEGPQTIVREVRFEGLSALGDPPPQLSQLSGEPLNDAAMEDDRRTLLRAFARRGYADATVAAAVEREPAGTHEEAVVTWRAESGAEQRVGVIVVQDNVDTRDEVILRQLPFKQGDPLDTNALLVGQTNIYQLGLFRTVLVRPLEDIPPAGDERDVGVMVAERPPGTLAWGVGFNTRDGFRGFGEAAYDNLNGMARRISLRGQMSINPTNINDNQYLATLSFREPRLAGSPWKLQASIVGERSTQLIDPYSIERVEFLVNFERPLSPHLRGGFEFQVGHNNLFDVDPNVVLSPADHGTVDTVAPVLFLVYDGRNDAFAPTEGRFESINVRYALPGISTVEFPKIAARHSQFVPLADPFLFVYALRGGWGLAVGGEDQLPINERFFLGGGGTVRGYSENTIGPLGADQQPIGGDVAINWNSEIRFPLVWGFGGAVFVDGGGVYLQDSSVRRFNGTESVPVCTFECAFTFENFRWSAGLGLRYDTPIGPLSLDYGFKIDRRFNESIGAAHFSIGAPF